MSHTAHGWLLISWVNLLCIEVSPTILNWTMDYHTSREMLQSLPGTWDGTNRLGTICARTIHFEQLDCQRNHDHPIGGIDVPSFVDIHCAVPNLFLKQNSTVNGAECT